MRIIYIYHSCFVLQTSDFMMVFDYWKDDSEGRLHDMLSASDIPVYFVASHFHEDHFNPEILSWEGKGDRRLLLSYDILKRRKVDRSIPTAILRPGEIYEDEFVRLRSFRSTDIGVSVAVSLSDGTTVFHAGDLNNWCFSRSAESLHVSLPSMEGLYLSILKDVAQKYSRIDRLMFPIDPRLGDDALRGIMQWLDRIQTIRMYPMHYWEQSDRVENYMRELSAKYPDLLWAVSD